MRHPPGRYPAHCSAEFGLSSVSRPPQHAKGGRGRPRCDSDRPAQLPTYSLYAMRGFRRGRSSLVIRLRPVAVSCWLEARDPRYLLQSGSPQKPGGLPQLDLRDSWGYPCASHIRAIFKATGADADCCHQGPLDAISRLGRKTSPRSH